MTPLRRRLAPLLALLATALAAPADAACRIAVDIGHSREQPGATSARGVPEFTFNAALGRRVTAALETRGVPFMVVEADGATIPLAERPRRAAAAGASLFVSLHHDSVQPHYLESWTVDGVAQRYSDRFSGWGLFVSERNLDLAESLRVATAIADGLLAHGLKPSLHHAEPIAGENRPLLDAARGIYRFDNLAVLHRATMPALLVESGIIVNRADEPVLAGAGHQDRLAAAIAEAAVAHCARRVGR